MFGGDRRKTFGINVASTARTPTKNSRFTDFGAGSSVKRVDGRNRLSLSQSSGQPRLSLFQRNAGIAPRDVKGLANSNAAKVHRFLVEHEGDEAPPEKTIRLPKGRQDFVNFFELIYQHLSKTFEIPQSSRLEDVIPNIFKGLGYPTALKSSYFQPMGSSHGYPHLLDALAWLTDFVTMSNEIAGQTAQILTGDFVSQEMGGEKTRQYSWIQIVYGEYTFDRHMIQRPEFKTEKLGYLRRFYEKDSNVGDRINAIQSSLEQALFECEELESDKGNEQKYKDDIARYKDDIRKAQDYAQSCEALLNNIEHNKQKRIEEKEEKEEEWAKIKEQVDEINNRIVQQKVKHGLSGEEVRKMNEEIMQDKELLRTKQNQMEELSNQIWIMSKKNKEAINQQQVKFGQILTMITKLSSGMGIETDCYQIPKNEQDLETQIEQLIKNWLPNIAETLNSKKLELEMQKTRIGQNMENVRGRVQIEHEKLEELKKKEAREERMRRKEREEWKEERMEADRRITQLENEKEVLEGKIHKAGHLDKIIAVEKENFEKLREKLNEDRTRLEGVIVEKVNVMVANVTEIENQRMAVRKQCDEIEERVAKLKN